MRPRAVILGSDPPSLPKQPAAPAMFDGRPHRNRGMMPCPPISPALLNRVIATAVHFGMPRREAEEARINPYVRTHVALLAMMVWDAARGDARSIAALERIRFAFGNAESVAEILAATEQPPDSEELQRLLGAD